MDTVFCSTCSTVLYIARCGKPCPVCQELIPLPIGQAGIAPELLPTCINCGTPMTRRHDAKYCGNGCRLAAKKKYLSAPDTFPHLRPQWERPDKKKQFAFRNAVAALGFKMHATNDVRHAMWYLAAQDHETLTTNHPDKATLAELLPSYANDLPRLVEEYPAWRAKRSWAQATPLAQLIATWLDHPVWSIHNAPDQEDQPPLDPAALPTGSSSSSPSMDCDPQLREDGGSDPQG